MDITEFPTIAKILLPSLKEIISTLQKPKLIMRELWSTPKEFAILLSKFNLQN